MSSETPLEFPLLGRPLRALLRSPRLASWLTDRWCFEEHALAPHPYRIELEEVPRRPADLPRSTAEGAELRLPGWTLRGWNRGALWWTGGEEAGVAADFGAEGARLRVWSAARGHPPPETYVSLYLMLSEAVRASGLTPVHAAVVAREGDAIALTAPSGTGKTTTLLRLLGDGWSVLAEDLAWLDPGTLLLHGWDRGVRLWPGTAERFLPHLAAAPWVSDPDGKRFLGYSALGARRAPRATLTRMVRLQRSEAPLSPDEAPLSPREAVRTLWQATGVPLLPESRARLANTIPSLLRRVAFSRCVLAPAPDAPAPRLARSGPDLLVRD